MTTKCPRCDTENPSDSKYCKECATLLPSSDRISVSPTRTIETYKGALEEGSPFAGRYHIIEELGKGGMGTVYKAKDMKLKRTVALKFLPPELTRDREAKERFIQEAQAAAAMNHAHISVIYEIDEAKDQTFISMEYIEGQSLKERIESGPMGADEAIEIAIQVGEGLQEAHEQEIVHRDIKPANIMLTEKRQAKIVDFGLAKLANQVKLTRTGAT